ncbi:MAG: hypothetical protein QMD61_10000 [Methanobacterium sp.]|nr:hypothetical protein [Methanobacterium sp.]
MSKLVLKEVYAFIYIFIYPSRCKCIYKGNNHFQCCRRCISGESGCLYATYYGYDEIAHQSGIRDADVFNVIRQLDK